MTNSMNNIINNVKNTLKINDLEIIDNRQFAIDVQLDLVHSTLVYLKANGFTQLSILTCVDWIKDNNFQLVYILNNWEEGIHVLVRAMIDRENPKFITATNIYPGIKFYEREVHEFFGIEFVGNEDSYKGLILELWDDMPPLRKDFDPQAYSDEKYEKRDLEKIYKPMLEGDVK